MTEQMEKIYAGRIIKESLSNEQALELVRVVETKEVDIDAPAPGQPPVWHLVDFEVEDSNVPDFVEQLSNDIKQGTWYVNLSSDEEMVVVFRGKVFRYALGNVHGKGEAQEYGRALGIPESQLDW